MQTAKPQADNLADMTIEQLLAYRRALLSEILKAPYREPSRLYALASMELRRRGAR
mgnify:CR=1 FL=1